MPPQNPQQPGNDPHTVDISLSLLSDQDSQAAKQLAESLKQIADMFKAIQATDFVKKAEKLAELSQSMQRSGRDPDQWASHPAQGSEIPSGMAQGPQATETPNPASTRQQLGRIAKSRETVKNYIAPFRAAITGDRTEGDIGQRYIGALPRQEDYGAPGIGFQGDPNMAYIAGQGGGGGGGSLPPNAAGGGFNLPEPIRQSAYAGQVDFSQIDRGFEVPRFGNFTIQDILRMRGGSNLRRAVSIAGADGDPEPAMARSAMYENLAQKYVPIHAIGQFGKSGIQRLQQMTGFDPAHMVEQGQQLGYSPAGGNVTIPGTNIGFRLPVGSDAAAEGWRQQRDTARLQTESGISQQQARGITETTAAQGFGGDMGSRLRMDFFGPAVRQTGVDPNEIASWTQNLRVGTSGITQLTAAAKELGPAARAASMNVNETAQSVNEYAEAAKKQGGTQIQGVRGGEQFQTTTGLPASVGAQLMENPFVQMQMLRRTGLVPGTQGAAPQAFAGSAVQAVNMMTTMFERSGAFHNQTDEFGHQVSGRSQAEAMAAQQLGIDVGQLRQLRRSQGRATAGQAGTDYGSMVSEMKKAGLDTKDPNKVNEYIQSHTPEGKIAPTLGTTMDYLKQAGVSDKEMRRIGHLPAGKQAEEIRKALGHQAEQQRNKITIELSSQAKKLFKLKSDDNKGKDFVNASVRTANQMSNSNIGPSPLGPVKAALDEIGIDI